MVPDSLGNMNGILTEPGLRERIKVPEGRVLENEKTHWNLRVILVVGGEKAGVRIHCPVNERSWIHV